VDHDLAVELAALLAGHEWRPDALSAEPQFAEPVEFFPEGGQPSAPAKAVCAGCLVSAECLSYALELGMKEGVWGGTTGNDRKKMRSAQRQAA
jgi:WhiB family redox-sensing transcriptional regulator